MTASRFRCSEEAESRDEPLYATASTVTAWIVVEQPGPWGPEALLDSRFPLEVAVELERRSAIHEIRPLLIRRGRDNADERAMFLAHSGGGGREPVMVRLPLTSPEDVLEVDLSALAAGEPVGFPQPRPIYLVCTHGRHDICCADRGRPLYRASAGLLPDRVWETSHIGGDRFAGNVLVLPHGAYFGRVEPENASRLIQSFEVGRLELDLYRGRSTMHRIAQAADHFVRDQFGWVGIDDVEVISTRRLSAGSAEVALRGPDSERLGVRVEYRTSPEQSMLTCRAPYPTRPPVFSFGPLS